MIPTVGIVYKFSFSPGYTALNGIYHVGQILTFQEMLKNNESLVDRFYALVDKSTEDYNADLAHIRNDKILKLLNPDTLVDSGAIFAPMYYLNSEPDFNVKKYYNLAVGLNLGLYENPEQLSYILTNLKQQFEAALGITNAPELFEINHKWMTKDDFETNVEDVRKSNATSILNYFSETKRLETEITKLRSKLAAYEDIIAKNIPANGG